MKYLIFTLFFLHFLVCGFSQTNIWQGDVTSNWHLSGNWSLNHVPTSSENVIIPDVTGFNPIVYGDAHCNNLTINSDGRLVLVDTLTLRNMLIETGAGLYADDEPDFPSTIKISGDWQNNNTSFNNSTGFSPGYSVVEFNGTSSQTIVSNCPTGDFASVVINSTSTVIPTTNLHILDNFTLDDGIFNAPAELYIGGSWISYPTGDVFNEGTGVVIFDGDQFGFIQYTETFYDVIIDKSFTGVNALQIGHSTYINVSNDFQILDGSVYIVFNSSITVANDVLIELGAGLHGSENPDFPCRIYLGGDWQNNNTSFSDSTGFSPGSSVVEFNGTSIQNIISNCPDGDFDGLRINSSTLVQCVYSLDIGSIIIYGGVFVAPPEINVERLWGNNVGEAAFDEGTGLVVFHGSEDSYCSNEIFYHLEIDKPGATLQIGSFISDDTVCCAYFDWTSGGYELGEESAFIVNDLVDDGIYGDITVNEGALLSLTQGTGTLEYVDLNGNLTIHGGEVHVYGGADDSYWTYVGNASITMTDGSLHFNDVGIRIDNNVSYTFSENISGGEIHTASNFIVERSNFTPTSHHLYMDGTEDAVIDVASGSYLSYLDINKSAKKAGTKSYKKSPRDIKYQNSAKANHVVCPSDLIIQGDFTIHNGSFSAPSEMRVRRDWINNVGEGAFIENTGLVTFFGAVDSEIKYDEVFYDLCNEKDFDVRYLRTAENLNITVLNDLHLNQGVFFTETGNTVEIANTVQFIEGASWWAGNTDISIAGDWDNQCSTPGIYSGFRAQNSTVTFNGMADQLFSCDYAIEEFNILEINNTGSLGNDAFIPNSNVRVTNNLEVIDGHWSDIPDGNAHEFFGDVNVGIDGNWTDPVGIVNLLGPTNKSFYNNGNGYFDVIMFNRDNPTDQVNVGGKLEFNYLNLFTGSVQLAMNNYLNHSAIYVDANGSLNFAAGAGLISDPGAAITIYAGGKIAFNGTNGNNCVVTINGGPGYYYFNIEGEIAAEYTDFSNMAADGISVLPAGSVDPLHAFNNCSFSYGESGGTYLAINSNQNLTCDGATFHSNSWGGNSNVRKITDDGGIIFTNYSGDFAGEDYDDDPFDRIQWDDGSREIDLTVMLEGPYNSGIMKTSLNDKNLLPSAQPYNISPWNYTGTESVPNMPNPDIVDWILIEYRDAVDAVSAIPATTIGWQAALLLNNGNIIDLDGISILDFSFSINDNLFVIIHHRNHLPVMSANAILDPGFVYTYNFTTASSQAYGTDAMIDLGGGVFGIYGGDGNADGTINTDDKTTIWSIESGTSGFMNGDYNMDSQTDNSDKNDIWTENNSTSSQIPE